jgi:hypothetical protein
MSSGMKVEKLWRLPDHETQVIVRPLLRKILRDLGMKPGEYHHLLNKL